MMSLVCCLPKSGGDMRLDTASKLVPTWFDLEPTKPDEESVPGFMLKPLSSMQFMQVAAGMTINESGAQTFSPQAVRDAFRMAVTNWRNVTEEDDQTEVEFSLHLMDYLPFKVLNAVFSEIITRATIREYERKN